MMRERLRATTDALHQRVHRDAVDARYDMGVRGSMSISLFDGEIHAYDAPGGGTTMVVESPCAGPATNDRNTP